MLQERRQKRKKKKNFKWKLKKTSNYFLYIIYYDYQVAAISTKSKHKLIVILHIEKYTQTVGFMITNILSTCIIKYISKTTITYTSSFLIKV